MVNAVSNFDFSCFGYKLPTIEEIFGLKNPLPKTIIPKAVHNKIFAKPKFVLKMLALKNNIICPTAIMAPPSMIQFLLPKYLSDINPPKSGVK